MRNWLAAVCTSSSDLVVESKRAKEIIFGTLYPLYVHLINKFNAHYQGPRSINFIF